MAKRQRDVCGLPESEPLWRAGRGFVVRDLPWTEEKLRVIPPFEFENCAVIALGGIPNKVQVGDMGVDGRIYPVSLVHRGEINVPVIFEKYLNDFCFCFSCQFTIDSSADSFHFSSQMVAAFLHRFCAGWLLLFLFVPVVAQAQFTYSTNNSEITIVSYTGSGGAVALPDFVGIYPVTTIGMTAFFGKTTVTSIAFNTNLTTIGYNAFGGCSGLTSLTIPNSVTNIGQYAFEPCTGLTNVTLPNQLDKIQIETFGNCSSLASIIIPASVTNIGSAAFDLCSSLTAIYFLGNQPTPGANMFHSVNASAIVYYLAGTIGWSATYGGLPTVMLSPGLEITGAGVQNSDFAFTINGTNGQVVVVQAATNLMSANWQPLMTNTLSGTSSNFTDVNWKSYLHRFYRLYSP